MAADTSSSGSAPDLAMTPVLAMTIDVEDWYHVENLKAYAPPDRWDSFESRIEANMERLLELFARHNAKGTFFVLGRAVEKYPHIVKNIVAGGHELACHGWSHELIYRQSPEVFREETRRAKAMLEDLGGVAVHGYRASTFSVVDRTLWALDILAEEGFTYDSSIAPLHHDRYGIPDATRAPHRRELAEGRSIVEFPVSILRACGRDFPLGGGFFRLFPLAWTSGNLARYEKTRTPAMFYLHPWEIDPGQPRATGLKWTNKMRHYARLGATYGKLDRLFQRHAWGTMLDLVRPLLTTQV